MNAEEYSTPSVIADLSEPELTAVQLFIHQGIDSPIVDSLVLNNPAIRRYIDEQTEAKL